MSIQEIKNRLLASAVKVTANLIKHTIEHILPMATVTEESSESDVGVQKFLVTLNNEKSMIDKAKLIQRVRTALVGFDVSSPIDGDAGLPAKEFTLIVVNKTPSSEAAALTKKQEQLDVNEDGKIDKTDLKKLREGKKPGDEKEEARIKGDSEYDWFTFTGKSIEAENDKGRTLRLVKGDKFGARKSSNGKLIRLVTEKEGLTKVFTCDMDLATYLGKNCKAE